VRARVLSNGQVPLRYVDDAGEATETYPFNPNGSETGIAGLCSPCGRHTALMPYALMAFTLYILHFLPLVYLYHKLSFSGFCFSGCDSSHFSTFLPHSFAWFTICCLLVVLSCLDLFCVNAGTRSAAFCAGSGRTSPSRFFRVRCRPARARLRRQTRRRLWNAKAALAMVTSARRCSSRHGRGCFTMRARSATKRSEVSKPKKTRRKNRHIFCCIHLNFVALVQSQTTNRYLFILVSVFIFKNSYLFMLLAIPFIYSMFHRRHSAETTPFVSRIFCLQNPAYL
jgi:hypothetical protein